MLDQKNKGYARLIWDLADSDQDGAFQQKLARSKGPTRELSRLLQLAKELGARSHIEPGAKSDHPLRIQ